ncbi:MAG: hypothetical protein KGL39_23700 [Patescibacteria group bacterium]|nr:hypothetical protein [Patescibacteria group bacterium]
MAIALVQKGAKYDNNTAPAITGVTSGNFLVLSVTWLASSASTITGITDSAGGTWQSTTVSTVGSSFLYSQVWYLPSAAAGTHTLAITWSASTGTTVTEIAEFSGVGSLDTQGQTSNASTASITSSSLTPAQAGELLIAVMAEPGVNSADGISDPPTGWTSLMAEQNGFSYMGAESCYLINSGTTAQSATWSIT